MELVRQEKVEEMSAHIHKLLMLARTRYEEELAERVRKAMEQLPELRARLDALKEEDARHAKKSEAASKSEHEGSRDTMKAMASRPF